MSRYSNELILTVATYIKTTDKSIREVATDFGLAKSTVHDLITKSLISINPQLAEEVKTILQEHRRSFNNKRNMDVINIT